MAEKLTPATGASAPGTTNAKHNIANLNEVIRECAGEMLQIKRERGDLNERAGDIRTRLKDAGVQTAAFDFALRVKDMEQEARDSYLDSLQVNFDALGIGGQLSMFPDAASTTAKANGADKAPAKSKAKAAKKKSKSKATKAAKPEVSRGAHA
jgi:hypothetical protein